MQEIKSLVRSLCAFLMRPIKCLFRAIPVFEGVGRALFRRFPLLSAIYLRLMPPLSQQTADSATGTVEVVSHLEAPPARKRPLTPGAEEIMRDLHAVMHQNTTHHSDEPPRYKNQGDQRVDPAKLDASTPSTGSL